MTCKDCIHSGLCYKENDYENFPDRCGDFISDKVLEERPQGEWIEIDIKPQPFGAYTCKRKCNKCNYVTSEYRPNFCPNCGASMKVVPE